MAAAFLIGEAGIKTDYEIFIDKIESDPVRVLLGTPLLAFQAPLLDILPMYVMVMLLAPFLIWLRVRGELALLVASGLMWMFTARFFPSIPTMTYDVAWNFNPFCWQFLFAIGLAFGWRTRTNMQPVASGESRRVLDICCVLFVAFSACVLMAIAFETFDDAAANRLRAMYFSLNKRTLDLWRVVGLLASAYLVARLISKDAAWLRLPLSRWVCAAGAASLPIFALTVVLSFAGKFFVMAFDHSILGDAIATSAGIVIILAVALGLKAGLFQADLRLAFWRNWQTEAAPSAPIAPARQAVECLLPALSPELSDSKVYDIAVIGGGINGAGIARDAAGRGLSVLLAEQDDLASHTSSASTKLIHGGLRYLENYDFRLVREALAERERLLEMCAAYHQATEFRAAA